MASGLNVSLLMGTVESDAQLRTHNGQPLAVLRLNTVQHNGDKSYPTQFMCIIRGELATQRAAELVAGTRVLFVGTHETGRIFNDADGQPGRTNDFSVSQIFNTATDDLNIAFLFGNIGQDAVLKNADSERPFASVSLATNLYAGKDGNGAAQQRTIWNRLTLNGKQATGLWESLKKGAYIGVMASYRYSKPYARNSGEMAMDIQFNADRIVFGGSTFKPNSVTPTIANDGDIFAGLDGAPTSAASPAGEPVGTPADAGINFDDF